MASVQLAGLTKSFGETEVVRGIDLEITSGEFLVLVGPSGCGKSTTLRMIAGLEEPTTGQVHIGGNDVTHLVPKKRGIGMVFQSYALYPHMSVHQNIGFGLALQGMPKGEIDTRVREVAATLGLAELLERKPSALSGGQRQRVAMGRAIARQPKVFLFDEPLSNLDAALRVRMRGELARLHHQLQATMIYVTHDQVEAMTLADRIAVLEQGILQQVGPPLTLYNAPANRFVAQFIGAPSMNVIDGEVDGDRFLGTGWSLEVDGLLQETTAIGFRPQHARLSEGGIRGEVVALERMGWEAFLTVQTAAGELVVRTDADPGATVGDKVGVSIDTGHLHLFGSDGIALEHRGL